MTNKIIGFIIGIVLATSALAAVTPGIDSAPTTFNNKTINTTGAGANTVEGSGATAIATGQSTERALSARFADIVNVADFGVLYCDGSHDDSTTINAATSAWSTLIAAGKQAILWFPVGLNNAGGCVMGTTLNISGIHPGNGFAAVVEGNGVRIYCNQGNGITGTSICVDATADSNLQLRDMNIGGNAVNIGLQIGNTGTQQCSGSITNVTINGPFNLTAFYDQGCEDVYFYNDFFRNTANGFSATGVASGSTLTVSSTTSGQLLQGVKISGAGVPNQTRVAGYSSGTGGNGTYTLSNSSGFSSVTITAPVYSAIFDGYNHWNMKSQYQTVTRSTDGNYSFNENGFFGTQFIATGTNAIGIWMANTHRHEYFNSYILISTPTTGPVVELYDDGVHGGNWDDLFDLHMETNPAYNFMLTGANATPILPGFTYRDHYNQVNTAIFGLDAGVTSATINDLNLQVSTFLRTPTVFDTPANYTVNGMVSLPSATTWALPAAFTGTLCDVACINYNTANVVPPSVLMQSAVPFVMTSSGSFGTNGALTGLATMPRTIGGAYAYFPANAICAASSAGWYWTNFTSATAGTVFSNTYTSGQPIVVASPTTFTCGSGPGAFTQSVVAQQALNLTVPGNSLGKNGSLQIELMSSVAAVASTKYLITNYGGTQMGYISEAGGTTTYMGGLLTMTNRGATNSQVMSGPTTTGDFTVGVVAVTTAAQDSTANKTFLISMQISTAATDFEILERYSFKLFPN